MKIDAIAVHIFIFALRLVGVLMLFTEKLVQLLRAIGE